MNSLTDTWAWTCHICGDERPDKFISVCVHDISVEHGMVEGTVKFNVRYCNDRPDCTERAKYWPGIKRMEER